MATRYWLGTADAVQQVDEAGINVFDAATTYGITINGDTVSVAGNTDEQTTTDDLVTALNLSTNPYFSAITWDRNGTGASSTVRGTADVAGCPFTFTTYANAGTGSWNTITNTTVNSGPNVWSVAANWSGATVPVSTDDVVIADSAVNICWGIDQNAVTLTSLTIEQTFTGRIGLDYKKFATTADGTSSTTTKAEYRENYLKISATTVNIGEHYGAGAPAGSDRILLDLGSNQSTITVHATGSTSAESGRNALRLLNTNSSSTLNIKNAIGGVGIATEEPGETATFSSIKSDADSGSSRLEVSAGTTVTTFVQLNGTTNLASASTVPTFKCYGGTVNIHGDFTITVLAVYGGTVYDSHTKSVGDCANFVDIFGGVLDTTRTSASRGYGTLRLHETGGTLRFVGTVLTISSIAEPTEPCSISVTPA